MDKNIFFAVILILLILLGYNLFLSRKLAKQAPVKREVATESIQKPVKKEVKKEVKIEPTKITVRMDTIDTPLYRVVLTSLGGGIASCRLKNYKAHNKKQVELIPDGESGLTDIITINGEKIDLSNKVYTIRERSENKLVYQCPIDNKRILKKAYEFQDTSYLFNLSVSIPGAEKYTIKWDGGMNSTELDKSEEARYFGAVAYIDGRILSKNLGSLTMKGEEIPSSSIDWVGVKNKYFLASIIPEKTETEGFTVRKFSKARLPGGGCMRGCTYGPPPGKNATRIGLSLSLVYNEEQNFNIFLGPLDYDLLRSFGIGLENACYMGFKWIRPISRFVLLIILFLGKVIPNYGVVIILFSLIMTVVFFPLTKISQGSMKKMAEIQPKMAALQKKYKNKPQELNKATMELYRKQGVNPMGGCLPLLIQMPIFFALYAILETTIKFRGAPFILWVKDLSYRDPYFILPILMGITMFLQQKIMGTQQAQGQQKMLSYMMPIFLTFIFLRLPSGIVLYWFSYNIFSIAQTIYLKREIKEKDKG
jgi:YidC/Oxa1 family membrane protein insertase